ncbi:MAG: type II toxin-antitoxin system PemK/MazF family toxin [Chloroflexota bacterium]
MAQRGEMWWAVLDPVVGREMGGHVEGEPRPVLVISTVEMLPTQKVVVVPATSRERVSSLRIPYSYQIGQRRGTGFLCCDDLRSIATERLQGPLQTSRGGPPMRLPSQHLQRVADVLRRILAL